MVFADSQSALAAFNEKQPSGCKIGWKAVRLMGNGAAKNAENAAKTALGGVAQLVRATAS
jgi:hypothetical protein